MKHKEHGNVTLLKKAKTLHEFDQSLSYEKDEGIIGKGQAVSAAEDIKKSPISTRNERLDYMIQSVPMYVSVPKLFQSQNSTISNSVKK